MNLIITISLLVYAEEIKAFCFTSSFDSPNVYTSKRKEKSYEMHDYLVWFTII